MRTFDFKRAKAGAPVVTRKGRKVRIICWNHKYTTLGGPIIGLVLGKGGQHESIVQYRIDGTQVNDAPELDLFMKYDYEEKS